MLRVELTIPLNRSDREEFLLSRMLWTASAWKDLLDICLPEFKNPCVRSYESAFVQSSKKTATSCPLCPRTQEAHRTLAVSLVAMGTTAAVDGADTEAGRESGK